LIKVRKELNLKAWFIILHRDRRNKYYLWFRAR